MSTSSSSGPMLAMLFHKRTCVATTPVYTFINFCKIGCAIILVPKKFRKQGSNMVVINKHRYIYIQYGVNIALFTNKKEHYIDKTWQTEWIIPAKMKNAPGSGREGFSKNLQ